MAQRRTSARWIFQVSGDASALTSIPGVRIRETISGATVIAPLNAAWLVERLLQGARYRSIAPKTGGGPGLAKAALPFLREWVPAFLTSYQKEGVAKALSQPDESGMLVHPCGSGKTLSAIVWALARPGLCIVATRAAARGTWKREIETYTQGVALVTLEGRGASGGTPNLGAEWGLHPSPTFPFFIIVGYETLAAWIGSLEAYVKSLPGTTPVSVVFDESHRAKAHSRWNATVDVDNVGVEDGGLPKPKVSFSPKENVSASAMHLGKLASRRLAATATPIQDRVRDLWAQLDLVHPWDWGKFRDFAKRYCLDPSVGILQTDGIYRPIGDLRKGDQVVGWSNAGGYRTLRETRVAAISRRISARVQMLMESGRRIICTPDHHWLYNPKSTSMKPYRRLFGELHHGRWRRPIKRLVQIAAFPTNHTESDDYQLGYIRGLVDGDGWSTQGKGKTRVVIAGKDVEHLSYALRYSHDLGLPPATTRLRKEDGLTEVGFYTRAAYAVIMAPWHESEGYRRGWLAGIYDAEGTCEVFSQYRKVNPEIHARIAECLRSFGFKTSEDDERVRLLGGRVELLRFYDLARPKLDRKRLHAWRRGTARMTMQTKDRIIAIAPLPPGEVVAITTETGNFIAEGYGSKNCDGTENIWGGMDTLGSSNLDELKQRLSFVVHRVPFSVSNRELPPKRRLVTYLKPSEQVRPEPIADEMCAALRGASSREGQTRLLELRLMESAGRKRKIIAAHVEDAVRSGQKVIVFTGRRKDAARLMEELEGSFPEGGSPTVPIWLGTGEDSPEARDRIREAYMAAPGPAVLVGTGDAFGESVDLQDTDLLVMAMLPYTPGQIIQREGRVHRLGQKRPVLVRYLICEGTVDEHVADILLKKLPGVEKATQSDEVKGLGRELIGASEEELIESLLRKVIGEKGDAA